MTRDPYPDVSAAIADLQKIMEPYRGYSAVEIAGESWDRILDGLEGVRKMAVASERELGAFRLAEAGRFGRSCVEQLATQETAGMILDPEGKIVRPDFKGGRS